jgi:hypothetical protein
MKLLKRIADIIVRIQKLNSNLRDVRNLTLESNLNNAIRESVNPLNKFGRKVFSQSDEDGITLEIVRRLEIMSSTGTYVELGVGNGLENNTLVLASLGWKGVWIGGESLEFAYENLKRMNFNMAWIKRSNILELVRNGLNQISSDHVDVLSIDLDGNDIYILPKNCYAPVFYRRSSLLNITRNFLHQFCFRLTMKKTLYGRGMIILVHLCKVCKISLIIMATHSLLAIWGLVQIVFLFAMNMWKSFWIFQERLNRFMCLQNISYTAILAIPHQPK